MTLTAPGATLVNKRTRRLSAIARQRSTPSCARRLLSCAPAGVVRRQKMEAHVNRTISFVIGIGLLFWPAVAGAQLPHGIPDLCAGSPDRIPHGQTVTLSGVVTKGCLSVEGTLVLADNVNLTVTTLFEHPRKRGPLGNSAAARPWALAVRERGANRSGAVRHGLGWRWQVACTAHQRPPSCDWRRRRFPARRR